MLSSDFLFPRFFVVPLANPSNFSHCKCFSSRIAIGSGGPVFTRLKIGYFRKQLVDLKHYIEGVL